MAAPVNTVLPVLTGTVEVGNALTVSNGTWTGGVDSYVYAWLRDGVAITGETTNSYTLQVADVTANIVGRVTATNVDGSTIADSVATVDVPSTLIVEDGTVVAAADCYITLANADTYHAKYGNTTWAALTAGAKESSLRKATQYMVGEYRQRWQGYRHSATQTLDWPRDFVYLEPFILGAVGSYPYLVSNAIVPTEVKNACAELALKASTATLAADITPAVKREKVDVIEVEYADYASDRTKYLQIDQMLKPYLKSGGGAAINLEPS